MDVGSLRCTAPALGIPPDHHYDPTDTEDAALRMDWAKFLFRAGYRLRYPQETTATTILLFHRFLIKERVGKHWRSRDVILTTCLFLAGKVTEAPRRLRDVINVIHMLTSTGQEEPPLLDKAYWTMKERIVEFEQVLLRSINFQVDPPDPYRLLLNYARSLRLHRDVTRTAWCLINDSLFCPRALATSQPAVACAAIRLAAKVHGCDRRLRWFSPPIKKCKREVNKRGDGDGVDPGNREREVETRDWEEGKGRDGFLASADIGTSEGLIVGPEAAGATYDGSAKRLLPSSVSNLSTRQRGEAVDGEGSRLDIGEGEDVWTTPWWGLFDARDEEVDIVCSELLAFYRSHSDRDASGRETVDGVAEKGVIINVVRDKAVDATGLDRSHKSLGVSSTLRDNH